MRKISIFLMLIWTLLSYGQQYLIKIDTFLVSPEEFEYMYKKNQGTDTIDIEKYLELFINYKLKVIEAIESGYDKDKKFWTEYLDYLLKIAEDSFKNAQLEQAILRKYYDYLQQEVSFQYLYKVVPPTLSQEDKNAILNKLQEIRQTAKTKEQFADYVRKYSDNRRNKQQGGYLGFMNMFLLPPEFVEPIWSADTGTITEPVKFGDAYYLFRVNAKRPTVGEVRVKQILVALPLKHSVEDSLNAMEKMKKIDSALKLLDFEEVARQFSDDRMTASRGGDMGWIKAGQTVPAFEKVIFNLDSGQTYGWFRTIMGYHYVKIDDKRSYDDFNKVKPELYRYLANSSIFQKVYTSVIDSLKKVYGYKQLNPISIVFDRVGEEIMVGKLRDSALLIDTTVLFVLDNKPYTVADFFNFLMEKKTVVFGGKDYKRFLKDRFYEFVSQKVKETYVLDMAKNYDTRFGKLAKEFYEGLLLFRITSDSVWSMNLIDTNKVFEFYIENQDKYSDYLYVSIFEADNQKLLQKFAKYLEKKHPKFADSLTAKAFDKKGRIKFIKATIISKEKPENLDFVITKHLENPKQHIFLHKNQLIYLNDKFEAIFGYIVADYQDYLDKKWLERLKKRHNISVNNQLLEQLKNNLEK